MKSLVLFLLPVVVFATDIEFREVENLKAAEAHVQKLVHEIRWLYQDDSEFLAAFNAAQKKWEAYCEAAMLARFPTKKKDEYGSVYPVAFAAAKISLVDARIKELMLWTTGTEEGDVSKGSVKYKKELEEIRKKRKG